MSTIILTGGGTGGHIMPNLALLPELRKHFSKICYIGSVGGMEKDILAKFKDVEYYEIPASKLVRKLTLKNLLLPFKVLKSICEAKKLIRQINPDVIFCKGGFVSVPVAVAGKKCKIPVISHESDISMGLANKIILHYAKACCVSFENTLDVSKKCIYTGSPIRPEIFDGKKNYGEVLKLDKTKKTVMFFGGSLGAKQINELVVNNLDKLLKKYNVIHIVGKNGDDSIKKPNYVAMKFCGHIQDLFACSDLIVCRSGANSIFELLALKKNMLLIPLSKAESRGDQIENANYFKARGWANVLLSEDATNENFMAAIDSTMAHQEKRAQCFNGLTTNKANEKIVGIILKYCK